MKYILIAAALLALVTTAYAQTADVPPGHWAHDAVNDLANRGLVMGYPDGNFLGNRSLTRYEMATLVKRVMDELDRRIHEAQAVGTTEQPLPASPTNDISGQDLARISQLMEEYKVELAVIGADLRKAMAEIEQLRSDVEDVRVTVNNNAEKVQTLQTDVSKLKKITVSGYVQARYEAYQGGSEGSLATNDNSFYVRRARLKLSARPAANTGAVVYFDADRGRAGVKEAYAEYYPANSTALGPYFRFGQYLWPFGYEVWEQSSSARETPERAIVNRTLFPGERDRGIAVLSPAGRKIEWIAGVFNGAGVGRTAAGEDLNTAPADDNRHKDVVGRLKYRPTDNLHVGVSGYVGKAITSVTRDPDGDIVSFVETDKTRWGADVQYYVKNASLKGEYITGKDRGFDVDGWWAQLSYNLTLRDALVGKYDRYDDGNLGSTNGVLSAWNLGWIRSLSDNLRLKVFREINKEQRNERDNNGWRVEMITRY